MYARFALLIGLALAAGSSAALVTGAGQAQIAIGGLGLSLAVALLVLSLLSMRWGRAVREAASHALDRASDDSRAADDDQPVALVG